jgi:hypothetical protein
MRIVKDRRSSQLTGPIRRSFLQRPHKCIGIVTIVLLTSFLNVSAQRVVDYAVQANIIYQFTKYIDWPENKKSGDFIIGVIGDTPLVEDLKKIAAHKTAGNQKIVVKRFLPSQSSYDCHILCISEEETDNLKKIVAKTAGLPVLLVGEEEETAQNGACISFKVESQKLKLEINKTNIDTRHLNIASELLQLAKVVK